jgi:hypothetical protein
VDDEIVGSVASFVVEGDTGWCLSLTRDCRQSFHDQPVDDEESPLARLGPVDLGEFPRSPHDLRHLVVAPFAGEPSAHRDGR